MHQACRIGDIQEVKEEIAEISIDHPDEYSRKRALSHKDNHGLTPLHYAVKYNQLEIVQLLVQNGADVNVRGKNGTTPIHYVTCFTRGSDASILQYLISVDADVNAIDDCNLSPLHYACSKGNVRVVEELTKCEGINIEARDILKNTPIHNACSFGSVDVVDMLISRGADVLAENDAKFTPVHVACSQGHEELLNHLLDLLEQKFGYGKLAAVLEQKNIEGQGLLHLAVLGSHISMTKNLLERGCDVSSPMEGDDTVFHIAATSGNLDMVELLLKFIEPTQVDNKNEAGRTPLHKAARFGKHRIVTKLLEIGADVDSRDNDHITPVMLASNSSGNVKTIQIVLQHKADVLCIDREDCTALHVATKENNVGAVKTLLTSAQRDEMINMKDKDSNTALHIACAEGFEDIAVVLMEKGADVKSRNNMNKTPLHLASYYGQDDVVDNIIDINSSTINDNDNDGNAALHLAAQTGKADVVKYLLKSGASVNDKNGRGMTPLELAASHGRTEAAKALIWGGASLEPSEETSLTPLHYATIGGHREMTEFLLEYCNVEDTDLNGRNALDLAIDNLNKEAAMVILNHRDWKIALRNKTLDEDKKVTTPIRKMIRRMPDLAKFVFDRCITASDDLPVDHAEFEVTLTFEFIDDVYNDWPCDIVRMDSKDGQAAGKGSVYTKKKIQQMMEQKETHTFSQMVDYERKDLVSHPLVQASLNKKWQKFAAYLYYFKLSLYIIFLFFFTGYILVTAPLREPYRAKDCTIVQENATLWMKIFVMFGKYVVLFLALVQILFEIAQLIGQGKDYLALDNLLEWTIYLLAIANVIDDFIVLPFTQNGLICGLYQKSFGTAGLFLAWLNFILFIRKVPVFGIYIVMFLFIFKTFFKFFAVFMLFIAAFGFSFFVLLQDTDLPAFKQPWTSVVKVGVMMTGEMNFDDIFFNNGGSVDPLLWVIFIFFVLVLNIILMNLLVGLAVDDIQEVQKQAEMTKSTMQVEICLDSEKTLPKMLRNKFIVKKQTIYPNKDDHLPTNISEDSFNQIKEILIHDKEPIDELQDSLSALKTNIARLADRVDSIDEQLGDMQSVESKLTDLKAMMKDIWKYQRRRAKKHPSSSPEKSPKKESEGGDGHSTREDVTKTDDETFEDEGDHTGGPHDDLGDQAGGDDDLGGGH